MEEILILSGFISRANFWFLDLFAGTYTRRILIEAIQLLGKLWPYLLALMIASPLINPNLFLLTTGAMGMEMALMRTLVAFSIGIAAGYLRISIGEQGCFEICMAVNYL